MPSPVDCRKSQSLRLAVLSGWAAGKAHTCRRGMPGGAKLRAGDGGGRRGPEPRRSLLGRAAREAAARYATGAVASAFLRTFGWLGGARPSGGLWRSGCRRAASPSSVRPRGCRGLGGERASPPRGPRRAKAAGRGSRGSAPAPSESRGAPLGGQRLPASDSAAAPAPASSRPGRGSRGGYFGRGGPKNSAGAAPSCAPRVSRAIHSPAPRVRARRPPDRARRCLCRCG